MLKHSDLAWLHTTDLRHTLAVRGRASAPEKGQAAIYAPDFALSAPQPWLIGEVCEWPAEVARKPLPDLRHRADPSSAEFARVFEDIQTRVHRGEFEKVVPMVCEELEFATPLAREMFHVSALPHQFAYGFSFDGEGMIGQTPELLFSVKDGILNTMALAGTGPASGPSLLDDRKERHEHGLVVEHILSEVREWGQVEVGSPAERTYGALKHLHTPIQVKLNREPSFMELVVRLHPTAALGGWPRRPAVEWLEKQNFHETRRRFGAPFAYVERDVMLCVVAIRGVQWQGARAQVSAGCGIVRESQVLREWEELRLKRAAIFRGLLGELA